MPNATTPGQGDASDLPLGYLRASAVLLVVAHHAATAYAGVFQGTGRSFPGESAHRIWGAFPIISPDVAPGLSIFLGLNDTFFMSLLFLLSGLFVSRSVERRGAGGFAGSRIVRLGFPFLLGALFLAPLAYLPAYLQISGGGDLTDFLGRWANTPNLTAGPVWFLWLLLAFDLAAALLFLVWKGWARALGGALPDGARRPALFFLTLVLLSMAAYAPMAAAFGSSHWTMVGPFDVQTSRLLHYGLYFLVGVALGAGDPTRSLLSAEGRLARGWPAWLAVAVASILLGTVLVIALAVAKGLDAPVREALGGIGFAVICAALCFLALSLFLRFVRRPNPVMDSLRDNSYGVFIVHYVFVNWLNYALLGPRLPGPAKFAIAFLGAAALSWLTAALGRRLIAGTRTPARADLARAPAS